MNFAEELRKSYQPETEELKKAQRIHELDKEIQRAITHMNHVNVYLLPQ